MLKNNLYIVKNDVVKQYLFNKDIPKV